MKVHLVWSYFLPTLFYGCEVWSLALYDGFRPTEDK